MHATLLLASIPICMLSVLLASTRASHTLDTRAVTYANVSSLEAIFPHSHLHRESFSIGPLLERIHESQQAPTGLAVDERHNVYLVYPRTGGQNTPNNVAICTSFNDEKPWPSAAMQNCTSGQDPSTCFVNVQNIILDSEGKLWILDSGIPYYTPPGSPADALFGGAKIMSFSQTGDHIRTYVIPRELLAHGMNANDFRINNTLGFAFITDASLNSSILAIDLLNGLAMRHLFNTSVVRADPDFVSSYDGRPTYCWAGSMKEYCTTGADGITLASGNLYWSVLASRRFYYVSQTDFISRSEEHLLNAIQDPGQSGSEQAGLTADDCGRVYLMASEQNAIFYLDTMASQSNTASDQDVVHNSSKGLVPAKDIVVDTLVRNDLIQHADSAAILGGWLYFCTNQLWLGPARQFNNTDHRRGPFASFRVYIGRGPAV